jgi:hypothetical protein
MYAYLHLCMHMHVCLLVCRACVLVCATTVDLLHVVASCCSMQQINSFCVCVHASGRICMHVCLFACMYALFFGDSKNEGQGQIKGFLQAENIRTRPIKTDPVKFPRCLLAFAFRTMHNRPLQMARDP